MKKKCHEQPLPTTEDQQVKLNTKKEIQPTISYHATGRTEIILFMNRRKQSSRKMKTSLTFIFSSLWGRGQNSSYATSLLDRARRGRVLSEWMTAEVDVQSVMKTTFTDSMYGSSKDREMITT